jgi:hypothetical protein
MYIKNYKLAEYSLFTITTLYTVVFLLCAKRYFTNLFFIELCNSCNIICGSWVVRTRKSEV